jgi:uncharacterized membrane protein YcaP (DUF421 family)
MFNISLVTALEIAFRSFVIYLVILIGLRLAGKREVGQLTVFDLVVLLLIANAVQNAMVGPDTSLIGGIIAAATLLVVNTILARLRLKWPRLRHWVEGTPTLLVLHGETIARNMQQEGMDEDTLLAALREHGVSDLSEVEMAVLETDGSISVVPIAGTDRKMKKPTKAVLK